MSLPPIATPSLLASIRARTFLPPNVWYFVAGVTLSVLNRPDEIPRVFQYAIEKDGIPKENGENGETKHDQQLRVARRLREALVKAAPIGGLPKSINALLALKSATPPSLLDEPLGYSPSARSTEIFGTPSPQIMHRGQKFFDQVYGKVSQRVMVQMDRSGTEDLGLTARLMYGYILSNTNVLSAAESSFVLIAGIIPQDVNPQLKGHLKGAINNGATVEEVNAVRDIVLQLCRAAGMRSIASASPGGWGWRGDVASLAKL